MTYDFYDLLDVPEDAPQEEVKRAFRERVREVHPDLNDDPRAPAQFTALKKGYDVLKDPVERRAYDRMGHVDYVAKRMEGLPDPERWAPRDGDDGVGAGRSSAGPARGGSATSSGTSGTATGRSAGGSTSDSGAGTGSASSGSSRSSASSRSSRSGSTSSTQGSRASSTTASSTSSTADAAGTAGRDASVSSSRGARSSTAGGSATASSTASNGAGSATVGGSAGTGAIETSLLDRLRGNVGWPLVFATAAFYLAGLAGYLLANREGVRALATSVAEAPTPDAAWAALTATDYAVATPYAFVESGLLGSGSPARAALLAAGAVVLPAVYLVVVRMTRTARSFAWTPTYLYVLAALGPLGGLAVSAPGVSGATRPAVSLAAVAALPVLAIVTLPLNAFVMPRVRRRFR